jgi:predicted small lipoprotein YifL
MRSLVLAAVVALAACGPSDVIQQDPVCLPDDARVQFSVDDAGAAVTCPTADAIEETTWGYYLGRVDVHVIGCEWRCAAWDCALRPKVTAFFIQAEGGRWEPSGYTYGPGVASCP